MNYTTQEKLPGTYTAMWNVHRALKELNGGEIKTYAFLCDSARQPARPGWSWPSQQRIAEGTGQTRKVVSRHVKQLQAKGFVTVYPRVDADGFKRGNYYQIMQIEEPPAAETKVKQQFELPEKQDYGY